MYDRRTSLPRRRFLALTALGATVVPIAGLVNVPLAAGADKPKLEPDSDRARQFSYTHDASSTENAARKEGARCVNCSHFRADEGAQWAPCNIFPDKRVSADGWCAAWVSAG